MRVEAENVDGRAAKSGTASVDVSSPDTQIALARDKAARKSISDATIESVTVNGIEYTRDLDMWTYDEDTGTLDILIAAAGVRSVDIKLANDAEKNVGSWLAALATEAFAGNVWNIGTWEFQSAPWAGMSFHTAGHNKYTGARGKSGCNDANAEYIAELRAIMEKEDVRYQTSELGKVDQGGGGTIAYILANYGMEVIDCGVALHNMHAPWEISSKADIYETTRGYQAFLKHAK